MKILDFKGQNFDNLKRKHNAKKLFVDKVFPANIDSLAFSDGNKQKYEYLDVKWKRPQEINSDPKFVVDGYKTVDINQGNIGDCWFVGALIGVTACPMILAKIIPPNQSFDHDKDYAGIFHFRFWVYGNWYDIVVDDMLPYSEQHQQLIHCSNVTQVNEFWTCLLEKAYAKLYGSYECLEGGLLSDALVDMSGGIIENLFPKNFEKDHLDQYWSPLFQSYFKNSLMGVACEGDYNPYGENKRVDGIFELHAYAITKMAVVKYKGRDQKLIRIKNPHGKGEWNGKWSDDSKEWNDVSNKKEIDFVQQDEGEFWMSFEDFVETWDRLYICHLTFDSFISIISEHNNIAKLTWENLADDAWKEAIIHSSWEKKKNSGGCDFSANKYWTNPKFVFKIENAENNAKNTVILSLSQKKDHLTKNVKCEALIFEHSIRLDLFKLPNNYDCRKYTEKDYKRQLWQGALNYSDHLNTSTVDIKTDLANGSYLLIPCTDAEDINLDFMIRMFTDEKILLNSIDDYKKSTPKKNFFSPTNMDEVLNTIYIPNPNETDPTVFDKNSTIFDKFNSALSLNSSAVSLPNSTMSANNSDTSVKDSILSLHKSTMSENNSDTSVKDSIVSLHSNLSTVSSNNSRLFSLNETNSVGSLVHQFGPSISMGETSLSNVYSTTSIRPKSSCMKQSKQKEQCSLQ